jgi:hypothetical protein
MMGPKLEAQAALFYEFPWKITSLKATCCARLTVLLI